MTGSARTIRNILAGIAAVAIIAVAAALITLRTEWFRNYAREKIVAAVEDSTGGRVEVGSFDLDEAHLRATIRNLTIHGTEPAGSVPFLRAEQIVVEVRILSRLNRLVDISSLVIGKPEVSIVVLADGRSNIPTPKTPSHSNTSPLRTVVDLAIGHFELNNGVLALESRKLPMNVHANNLLAQIAYSAVAQTYQGTISMAPVYVAAGRETPVVFTIKLPITVGGDRIEVRGASISTADSAIVVDGSVENIKAPQLATRVNGTVALRDLKNAGVLSASGVGRRDMPSQIRLAADVTGSGEAIQVHRLQVTLGNSSIEASGPLKNAGQSGGLTFHSTLDAGELGRLFDIAEARTGTVNVSGTAKLGGDNDYSVTGDLHARDVAIQQGTTQIRDIGIASTLDFNQNSVTLDKLVVTALGGRFEGTASLQGFQRYSVNGKLRAFDLDTALNSLGEKLPYDGTVSGGIAVEGDVKSANSLVARTALTITPGARGVPISGWVNADYAGTSDDLAIRNSYVALPHSRLDVDGALRKGLKVSFQTQDLSDLAAVTGVSEKDVALEHGNANRRGVTFSGMLNGGLRAPRITGHLAARGVVVEGRRFDELAADLAGSSSGAAVSNGVLLRAGAGSGMQARFSGSVGLSGWKVPPREPVSADLAIPQGDLADLVVLAGQNSGGYSGAITAAAHVTGTVGDPLGTLSVQGTKGVIDGQPFDEARVEAELSDQLVTLSAASVRAGAARIDLSGDFRHPADSFASGHAHAKIASNQIELATTGAPGTRNMSGTVRLNLDLAGDLQGGKFLLTSVNGNATGKALKVKGQNYGDLDVTVATSGQKASYSVTSDFAGSTVRVNGNTQLVRDYPTTADANIANLPVDKLLAVVNHADVPVRGNLSGSVRVTGTLSDPHGEGNLEVTRAVIYDEPIDRLQVRAAYLAGSIDVPEFQIVSGGAEINVTAHYDHPPGNLKSGSASFDVKSSAIELARIHNIQTRRPGLAGTLQITAQGEGSINGAAGKGQPRIALRGLNVNIAATGIRAQQEKFGDLKLTANTSAGNKIDFALDSNLADAAIHGRGSAELTDGYPVNAQLSFSNLLYSRIARLAGLNSSAQTGVEAAADGQATVNGPVLNTDQLHANVQLTRLNITAKARPGQTKPVAIANQGPLTVTLDHGHAQIQNAHLSGAGVDIQASGNAAMSGGPLALTVSAKIGLGVLPDFDRDIYSSGDVNLTATVRGTVSQPLVNGQLVLKDAAFSYAGFPNSISNANGVVEFNGQSASIQNLTAESGGGKITVTGFGAYGDVSRFGLHLKATKVRTRVQPGVSIVAGADVQLTGTSRRSILSGTAVIDQVTYNPQTDVASLLSRAEPSMQPYAAPSSLLENMRLDIRIKTSSGLAVQADIAQGISATADLRLQGTMAQPGVLGRITINEGKLLFFGSSYTVDSGTIAFYNPLRIDPILNVSLETQTQGIDVIVRVSGSVDNMKLSYTSNPPLQFQEIVGLLAAGRTPTSDPTLLANQPQLPQSSFEQMGESAALGEAVANPVAGRLQRVFGVSQLKIDPAFQGGSALPTARLTLQQRITSNLTFTYTSALDDPNGEIIKVEWAFDPRWSAVATRDQNGIFSVNFLYKREFR